jgi:hypothetical protein
MVAGIVGNDGRGERASTTDVHVEPLPRSMSS